MSITKLHDAPWTKMTYEEFVARCECLGPVLIYREIGKYGWTQIGLDAKLECLKLRPGTPGPHWVDAVPSEQSPVPRQYLIGSYDFVTGEGRVFWSL